MALMMYREALNLALRELLDHDERVFIVDEELRCFGAAFKATDDLSRRYCEKHIQDTNNHILTGSWPADSGTDRNASWRTQQACQSWHVSKANFYRTSEGLHFDKQTL